MKNKSKSNISIIGGADGPTSVFLVGRSGKCPLKDRIRNYFYKKKRERVAKQIVAGAHSLEEVADYIKKEYGAVEVSETAHKFIEQKKCLKESLIVENRPELLGDMGTIQLQEEIPMDYHVYEICLDDGRMDIDMDYKWDFLGCSYSGSKKEMRQLQKICREVYIYYGVTKEDIQKQTKRYKELVTALSFE